MKSKWICLAAILAVLCVFAGAQAESAEPVTLPAGITVIEAEAFADDASLTSVVIPEGAERIESEAFAGSGVTRAVLPASLTFIADDAFDDAPLTQVVTEENCYAYRWAEQNGKLAGE